MERIIHFDYLAGQELVEPDYNGKAGCVGSDSMGREGLLTWLEEQLGIEVFEPEQRLFAFYRLLNQYETVDTYIHRSFEKNPIATARVIMSWFDGLTLLGWRGEAFNDERLQRFRFLTGLYDKACNCIAGKSEALRIEQCLEKLQTCQIQLNTLVLAQPLSLLPDIWQSLVSVLADKNITIKETPFAGTQASKNNSVSLLSAAGVVDAASITAQYLSLNAADAKNILVVSHYGTAIDQALNQYSLPSAGFKTTSDARLITQIIPAILNTLSGNYSIESLTALFSHRLWLGDRAKSKKLARKLISNLGIGNKEWETTKDELLKQSPEVSEWVNALEHSDRNVEQLKKAVEVTRLKAIKVQQPIYREFARQCQVILDVLSTPANELDASQWSKVLKELGVGQLPMVDPLANVTSASACHGLLQPGHLTIEPDATVWVGPYFQPSYTLPDWYQPEFDALAEHYSLFSPEDDLTLQRNSWNHFVERAGKQLLIIDFDKEALTHPVFDELTEFHDLTHEVWIDYLNEQHSDRVKTSYDIAHLYPYACVARINQGLPVSDGMSASRLEKLIFKPSDFVLNYCAKLRDNNLELPNIDNRTRGIYVHALLEEFFTANPTPDTWTNIKSWEVRHHPEVFKQHALVFLEPGGQYDVQALREQSLKALLQLVEVFKSSNVVRVTPELDVEGWPLTVGGKTFSAVGKIDLLIEKADGSVMVLDAKWSNSGDKHTKALEAGFAIQLYTYASIYQQSYGRWPEVGYFIIKNNEFLVSDIGFLQGKGVNPLTMNFRNTAEAWQVTNDLAAWRLEQIERGEIELNNPGCDEIPGVSYPDDADLKHVISAYWKQNNDKEHMGDKYSDYRYLLGWRQAMAE